MVSREKIKTRPEIKNVVHELKREGKKVVFTNGCFDLLHPGHIRYLEKARRNGDALVVAINSDRSVQRLKGKGRPVMPELERCEVLGALSCVDFVTIFDEDTPEKIIKELLPNVLVKGGDWPVDRIVGKEIVEAAGGKVVSIDFERGFSTSDIISRVRAAGSGAVKE